MDPVLSSLFSKSFLKVGEKGGQNWYLPKLIHCFYFKLWTQTSKDFCSCSSHAPGLPQKIHLQNQKNSLKLDDYWKKDKDKQDG